MAEISKEIFVEGDPDKGKRCAMTCLGLFNKDPETNVPGCPGALSFSLEDGSYEGKYVQLCRNPENVGNEPVGINFCGNGADVATIFGPELPPLDEIRETIERIDY